MSNTPRGTSGKFVKKATTVVEPNGDETTATEDGTSVSTKHRRHEELPAAKMVLVENIWINADPHQCRREVLKALAEKNGFTAGLQTLRNVLKHHDRVKNHLSAPAVFCEINDQNGHQIYLYTENKTSVDFFKVNWDAFDEDCRASENCVPMMAAETIAIIVQCREFFQAHYLAVNRKTVLGKQAEIRQDMEEKLAKIAC